MYDVYKINKLIENHGNRSNLKNRMIFKRLKYYPLIMLISFFFPLTRRIYQKFHDEGPFWLGIAHTVGSGLYGALNAIVYGFNEIVLREYKKGLKSSIPSSQLCTYESVCIETTKVKTLLPEDQYK